MPDAQRYCAFLLRGWIEPQGEDAHFVWRFRMQDVQTGDQWAFTDPEAVITFLAEVFKAEEDGS